MNSINRLLASLTVGGVVFVMGAIAQPVLAEDLAKFSGGIGVIPTGSANTTVRGVVAAGQIWLIEDLSADVKQDGRIRVEGRGLLLGAGDSVGGNANASVLRRCSAQMMGMSNTVQILQAFHLH
jgi:hypothetical protein